MNCSKIEITCNGASTKIFVDGHHLKGVRRFELKQGVGDELPILTMDLNALELSTDVMAIKYHYGMGEITDISFYGTPNKDFIFNKIAKIYGIDENELREKIFSEWQFSEWQKANPSKNV